MVLCKSYPSEFVSYFQCPSLRFEDKPDSSYLKRFFLDMFILEGTNLTVFDWTILKYPLIGATGNAVAETSPKLLVKTSVGRDIRDKFSGAVEVLSRRNASGPAQQGEHSRQWTSSENVPSSKDVQPT